MLGAQRMLGESGGVPGLWPSQAWASCFLTPVPEHQWLFAPPLGLPRVRGAEAGVQG